jgi:hypothetical protein
LTVDQRGNNNDDQSIDCNGKGAMATRQGQQGNGNGNRRLIIPIAIDD